MQPVKQSLCNWPIILMTANRKLADAEYEASDIYSQSIKQSLGS